MIIPVHPIDTVVPGPLPGAADEYAAQRLLIQFFIKNGIINDELACENRRDRWTNEARGYITKGGLYDSATEEAHAIVQEDRATREAIYEHAKAQRVIELERAAQMDHMVRESLYGIPADLEVSSEDSLHGSQKHVDWERQLWYGDGSGEVIQSG